MDTPFQTRIKVSYIGKINTWKKHPFSTKDSKYSATESEHRSDKSSIDDDCHQVVFIALLFSSFEKNRI